MKRRLRFPASLEEQRGELVVEVLVACLLGVVFLMTLTEFYGIFSRYQNVNFIARRLTRSIEVSGTTQDIDTLFSTLAGQTGLTDAAFAVDAMYCDGVNRIQLRDTFTVTVSYTYYLTVFSPDFGPPLRIAIPMTSAVTGMSEVYTRI